MRRPACLLIVLLLVQGTAWAGELNIFGKFFAGGAEFDLALYTEGSEKVGVIGISAADGQRTSVAFAPDEWHSFAELWQKARKTRSSTWQPVGSFKETGTEELALLTVSTGPGVQFDITGKKGPFVFTLPASEVKSFGAKVAEMAKKLR